MDSRIRTGGAIGLIAAAGAAIAMWLVRDWVPSVLLGKLNYVLYAGSPWFAAASAAWAARSSSGRRRMAWICLSLGLVGWAFGAASTMSSDGLRVGQVLSGGDSWPFFLFPIGLGAALLLFPTGITKRYARRFVLDAAVVAGSFFLVFWLVVMNYAYKAAAGADRVAQTLPAVYAAMEIAVLTLGLLFVVRGPYTQRSTVALLTMGLVCIIVSDGVYTYIWVHQAFSHGSFVNTGWIAGMLLIGIAALTSRQPRVPPRKVRAESAWISVWLPAITGFLVVVAGTTDRLTNLASRPVLVLGACLALVVFARQFLAIRDNQRLLAEAAEQALRDPLTGLANYTRFNKRLAEAMLQRDRNQSPMAVIVLDLNDFKLVNDSYGHPAGDRLLMLVGYRIGQAVRVGDTVARLGGDEFGIVLTGPIEECDRVAHRVMSAFDTPFAVDGHLLSMRPSAGMAFADTDGSAISTETLLKQADTAMYSAKWAGSGSVHIFTADMDSVRVDRELFRTAEVPARNSSTVLTLLGEFRQAVDNAELTLAYQPQFRLQTGDLVGFEALLRWPHVDGGVLMPNEFLPMVRRHGLMDAVTDLVLTRACEDASRWRAAGIDASVAVNMFAPSLADPTVPGRIAAALRNSGLPPSYLTIEITEQLILGDVEQTRAILHQLREQQIRIAIDDFGTGYSTLSYLRQLPSDELKLDPQFIAPVLTDPTAAAVVRAVVGLARTLGIATVAEGVENAATADWLQEHGCDIGQGYFFGAPIGFDTLVERFVSGPSINSRTAPASAKSN